MSIVRNIAKIVYSYFFNGISIIRFSEYGKGNFIGKGLQTHSPQGIHIKNNVRLGRMCRLSCYTVKDSIGKITIEDNCYIGDNFSALSADNLVIKKNTLIASYVSIIAENHGNDPEHNRGYGFQELIGKPVIIDEHCWIGEKVIILPGVSIGKWCIIGSGAVVTKSIPDYSIAVGNPAKVIKQFDFVSHKWIAI